MPRRFLDDQRFASIEIKRSADPTPTEIYRSSPGWPKPAVSFDLDVQTRILAKVGLSLCVPAASQDRFWKRTESLCCIFAGIAQRDLGSVIK